MPRITLEPYRRVLAHQGFGRLLLIGTLIRIPPFATPILVTLHVVTALGRSYAEAGVAAAAATIAIAASGPLRGRFLDRYGLRRVVVPTTVVSGLAWAVAPWVGYVPLLVLVVVAGLFIVPTFTGIRQAIIAAVPEDERRTALSLDSAILEVCYMVAPAVVVVAASVWNTGAVLFFVQMVGVLMAVALWVLDPPLRADGEGEPDDDAPPRRTWLRAPFVLVCLTAAAGTLILAGTDLTFVAVMREFDRTPLLGVVIAVWALGSLVGGLLYGALPREVPSSLILVALALVMSPMALAPGPWSLAAVALVAGLFCAPVITATVQEIAAIVPASARGEAIGWHASSATAGGAIGAPLAGLAIDRWGAHSGFLVVAAAGVVVGLLAAALVRRPAARHARPRSGVGSSR